MACQLVTFSTRRECSIGGAEQVWSEATSPWQGRRAKFQEEHSSHSFFGQSSKNQ